MTYPTARLTNLWRLLELQLHRIADPRIILVWLLFSAVLALLVGYKPELNIAIKSSGGHIGLIEAQDSSKYTTRFSQTVLPGVRLISVPMVKSLNRRILLDTTPFHTPPKILKAEVEFLGLRQKIEINSIKTDSYDVREKTYIEIELPFLFTFACVSAWLTSAMLVLFMVKLWPLRPSGQKRTTALALAWLILCFGIFVYQVIWSSVWLPHMDDWRYYSEGPFSLFNKRYDWLSVSSNDTFFLTGQAIDWTLLGFFKGNFLAVRILGIMALAGFLSFAAALIIYFSRDFSAAGLVLLSLSISSSGYWGHTGIAYHQMLPVLFYVWSLWKLSQTTDQFKLKLNSEPLLVLSLCAGLAYISGPVLFIALGIASLLIFIAQSRLSKSLPAVMCTNTYDRQYLAIAILSGTGVATMALQIGIVVSRQGSLLEHSHASVITLPSDAQFWWFLAGLYGRATSVLETFLWLDVTSTVFFLAILLYFLRFALKNPLNARQYQMLLVSLSIGIGTMFYASMVSAGRSGLAGADSASWTQLSTYAKSRFHYWWLGALLPLVLVIFLELIKLKSNLGRSLLSMLIILIMAQKGFQMFFADPKAFEIAKSREQMNVDCLRGEWIQIRNSKKTQYECPDIYPGPLNEFMDSILARDLAPAREIFQYRPKSSN